MPPAAEERNALKAYLDAVPGATSRLARTLGVTRPAVQFWRRSRVPAERVLAVEAATGISRHDLRSDLYPRDEKAAA